MLSDAGLIAALAAAILVTLAELTGSVSVVASFLPVGLGAILGTWRQFSAEFGTTVADAPDGLRLRSGLIQTSAETIRPGRVQAVRLVEPLIWRAFGWCRLEVDIAGPRQHREDRSEARRLRTLIPVGSRADAEQMMAELLADRPCPLSRPPAAARWKAPLLYHFLGWGGGRAVRCRLTRPRLPEDDLDSAGEGAEHPMGAGSGAAQARPGDGPARRGRPPGDRSSSGPRCGRGGEPAGPAPRSGPRGRAGRSRLITGRGVESSGRRTR